MLEPNFSESQLQQAVNIAFVNSVSRRYGVTLLFPYVPSLVAEFDLGWDTAFSLPWLPHPPLAEHDGCNFFIQYKLSGELTSTGAKEWPIWRGNYFRFTIPHHTRNAASGSPSDDYHQWDCLKALAQKGYPTFYVTNSTLGKAQLRDGLEKENLLDSIPMLDVRKVVNRHKHVTFTPKSDYFLLHSEPERIPKVTLLKAIGSVPSDKNVPISQAMTEVIASLQEIGLGEELSYELRRIEVISDLAIPSWLRPSAKHVALRSVVRSFLGAEMLWVPRMG